MAEILAATGAFLATYGTVIGAGVAAGSAAYQGVDSAHNKKTADNTAAGQRAEQQRQAKELQDKEAQELKDRENTLLRSAELADQDLKAGISQGRQGTILTGPLGVQGETPQTGGKSLLGV